MNGPFQKSKVTAFVRDGFSVRHESGWVIFIYVVFSVSRIDPIVTKWTLCLHDLPSLFPKLLYFARSGPPFVIRSILIGWGCPGLQMVDLSERENGLWGRERGDRANTE